MLQILEISKSLFSLKVNKESSQVGWIPKISVACISCMSCQQTRPISSSRQHRISTKLGMQHHIYLLSSLIISFYILTKLLLCYMFSKGHITLTHFFSNTSKCMLIEPWKFFSKKSLEFLFQHKKPFQGWITTLVINTRLFTTLKNVDMLKIIEFYQFMHSAFCHWKRFEIFITCSLEDGFVCGMQFSKWRQIQSVAKCKYLFPSILP